MQIFSQLSVPLGFELRLNNPSDIYQRPTNFLRLLQFGPAPVPTQCWGRFYRSSLRLGQKKSPKIGKIWHPWYVKLNSPAAKPVGARHSGPGVPLAAREARLARGRPPHPALPPAARQHLLRTLPACPRRSASPGTTQTSLPAREAGREAGRPAAPHPERAGKRFGFLSSPRSAPRYPIRAPIPSPASPGAGQSAGAMRLCQWERSRCVGGLGGDTPQAAPAPRPLTGR